MRNDLAQMLVERPRLNRRESYRKHRRTKNRDPEVASTQEGMRRIYQDPKNFNEYFAPLLGILRKNAGRPWADVYSDIMSSLSGGGTVVEHVRTHLVRDFVIQDPSWYNGVPCYPPHTWGGRGENPTPLGYLSNVCYVDQSGILRYIQRKKRPRRETSPLFERKPCDSSSAYYKLEGVWYRVWIKRLQTAADGVVERDLIMQENFLPHFNSYRTEWEWGYSVKDRLIAAHGVFGVSYRKKQLNSKQIKQLRLNDR